MIRGESLFKNQPDALDIESFSIVSNSFSIYEPDPKKIDNICKHIIYDIVNERPMLVDMVFHV